MDTRLQILQRQFDHLRIDVIMAAYSEREAGWLNNNDEIDYYRMFYLVEGHAVLETKGIIYDLVPGRIYMLRPKQKVSYTIAIKQKIKAYWCHFRVRNVEDLKFMKLPKLPFSSSVDIQDAQYVVDIMQKMIKAQEFQTVSSNLRLHSGILELLAYLLDHSSWKDLNDAYFISNEVGKEKWDDVLAYIEQNLHHNIQIEDLAKVAYLHPNYLITSFKSIMGCSPIQYVTERRLELAKKLLKETDLPISEIAGKVGMLNHYLPRLLKRHTGITPKQYRRFMRLELPKALGTAEHKEVKD
ncbi:MULTISPECIES: AraC family transcriptional regulator [unclassified Paenibacillus]|uniref:helix-turn-helix domain-containing protein n=1 Tax=unclassified Paenibacillus TaxID=185978 RepID=UPI00104A755C|nr:MULTISPECIES: AraC family transcriptional regulator [unclassified Paenibacillus]NIK70924.1 AraC-like DNA-binding protein [Paenibacillus sp. BK720]TCM93099.1 AraC-like DNA-binding protein [Paenibacillus sp. BK033]